MNTGFGISEILIVLTIVVVFFGSKELPKFLREIARLTAKIRRYSDRIKRELDDVTRSLDPQPVPVNVQRKEKEKLRTYYLSARKNLPQQEREQKSAEIIGHLRNLDVVKNAAMIMLYVEMGAEVITQPLIRSLLKEKKRVVLPYCVDNGMRELRGAEIADPENDIIIGKHSVPEPREELRKHFFKSDLEAVICPVVAFDPQGGRLGRGKGYYDTFLREIRGKIPLIGIAFDCQMMKESIPFEYHDVPMDTVVTENGVVVGSENVDTSSETGGDNSSGQLAG